MKARRRKQLRQAQKALSSGLAQGRQRVMPYIRLMRLDRPIGTWLLLWPAFWALWIAAEGFPDPWVLAVICAGTLVMRSAGCVINDWADRDFDPSVKRTRERPLAAREFPAWHALVVFVVLCLIGLGLVFTLNRLTQWLAIPGAILAIAYPFLKRYTYLPQVGLGMAFGWAVPMAYAAQADALPTMAWLLYTLAILWAVIYDTQYAMVDRDDDLKIGVKSTAILFGEYDRAMLALLQGVMILALVLVGDRAGLSGVYYAALALAAALFGYQQWLIRDRSREGCFKAFFNNHALGMFVFLGILLHYAYAPSC